VIIGIGIGIGIVIGIGIGIEIAIEIASETTGKRSDPEEPRRSYAASKLDSSARFAG
jgi:hypothetical protein